MLDNIFDWSNFSSLFFREDTSYIFRDVTHLSDPFRWQIVPIRLLIESHIVCHDFVDDVCKSLKIHWLSSLLLNNITCYETSRFHWVFISQLFMTYLEYRTLSFSDSVREENLISCNEASLSIEYIRSLDCFENQKDLQENHILWRHYVWCLCVYLLKSLKIS